MPTAMPGLQIGEIFARIGALEAEVRRLGQENSRLHETIVSRTEDIASRKRSEEHTSELQSHSEISYAVFCLDRKSVV